MEPPSILYKYIINGEVLDVKKKPPEQNRKKFKNYHTTSGNFASIVL
jgi:hypothetical protein